MVGTTRLLPKPIQLVKVAALTAALSLLSACSNSSTSSSVSKPKSKATKTTQIESNQTSQMLVSKLDGHTDNNISMRIRAAELAIKEQQPQEYIKAILAPIDVNQFNSLENDIKLARLLLMVASSEKANIIITRLKQGVLPKKYQAQMWVIRTQLATLASDSISVLSNAYRAKSLFSSYLSQADITYLNQLIWQHILKVPNTVLTQFSSDFGKQAQDWQQLSRIINRDISDPTRLYTSLAAWVNAYNDIEPVAYLPEEITKLTSLQPFIPKKVALILPFTGNRSHLATAVRNGFLAQFNPQTSPDILFIDSETHSVEQIEQIVEQQQIEFIIGPLVKEKIELYKQSEILTQKPWLALNTIAAESTTSQQYYFALSPEDEIIQAVDFFIDQDVKHPAIIYADNSIGNRLSQQFLSYWQQQTGYDAEFITFRSKSKLGQAVTDLLDVSSSEQRIDEMEKLFGKSLKSEKRSRADIDAIYVIANPQQTRLIKPFFDVNVSTFGNRLPVYASSRSYLIGETREQKKDLNGLTFTEMPWLVRNKYNNLTVLFNQIETNNTQLKKLFAFGYDAATLVNSLIPLSALPNIELDGLTGKLKLEGNNIKRELSWSQYNRGRIVAVSASSK